MKQPRRWLKRIRRWIFWIGLAVVIAVIVGDRSRIERLLASLNALMTTIDMLGYLFRL